MTIDLPANNTQFLPDADAVAAAIPDGALLAMPADNSIPAMAVVRALIRRRARELKLLGVPTLGLCADLLIGAGCVAEIETSAVSLGEAGLAPRFTDALERGAIRLRDATCPMIHSALQAAESCSDATATRSATARASCSISPAKVVSMFSFLAARKSTALPILISLAPAAAIRSRNGVSQARSVRHSRLRRFLQYPAKNAEHFIDVTLRKN